MLCQSAQACLVCAVAKQDCCCCRLVTWSWLRLPECRASVLLICWVVFVSCNKLTNDLTKSDLPDLKTSGHSHKQAVCRSEVGAEPCKAPGHCHRSPCHPSQIPCHPQPCLLCVTTSRQHGTTKQLLNRAVPSHKARRCSPPTATAAAAAAAAASTFTAAAAATRQRQPPRPLHCCCACAFACCARTTQRQPPRPLLLRLLRLLTSEG